MKKQILTPNNCYIILILLIIILIVSCYKCREYFTEHATNKQKLIFVLQLKSASYTVDGNIKDTSQKKYIGIYNDVKAKYETYANTHPSYIKSKLKFEGRLLDNATNMFILYDGINTLDTYILQEYETNYTSNNVNNLFDIIRKYNIKPKSILTLTSTNNEDKNKYKKIFKEVQHDYAKFVENNTKYNEINIEYKIIENTTNEPSYFTFTNSDEISTDLQLDKNNIVKQIVDYLKNNVALF